MRILLVIADDDLGYGLQLRGLLESLGHTVSRPQTVADASLVLDEHTDAVLIGLGAEGAGLDLAALAKHRSNKTRIGFYADGTDESIIYRARRFGHVVPRPMTADDASHAARVLTLPRPRRKRCRARTLAGTRARARTARPLPRAGTATVNIRPAFKKRR